MFFRTLQLQSGMFARPTLLYSFLDISFHHARFDDDTTARGPADLEQFVWCRLRPDEKEVGLGDEPFHIGDGKSLKRAIDLTPPPKA